jgi:2-methylcitrate dehydratase PrpD
MTISETLAEFAATLDCDGIPPVVRTRAKHLILDAAGIALASSRYDFARQALAGLLRLGRGDADVIGFPDRLPLRDAVLMNGILVHGLDYDDTYLPGSMHLTASNVPVALAMAANEGSTGRELLTACVLGLETGARLAGAAGGGFQKTGFHATGVCAAFSGAIVAGKLMGLDAARLATAQGIALSTASGSMQPIRDGSWTKRMHPGWAGAGGITAASLALGGFVAPLEAYEGIFGFYTMYLGSARANADLALITANLGRTWEVERASIKLYPAGHLSHAFMTAAIHLAREHAIDPAQVDTVLTRVGGNAIPLICEPAALKCRPTSGYMAQFSLPYAMACCLTRRRFSLAELEPGAYDDPALIALARKVRYEEDPDSGFPKLRSGEVIVRMKDGRELRRREVIDPDRPESNAEIVAKFMDNARMVMPEARAAAIRDRLLAIEDESDTRALARMLAGG